MTFLLWSIVIGLLCAFLYIAIAHWYINRLEAARKRTRRYEVLRERHDEKWERVNAELRAAQGRMTLPDVKPTPILRGCDMPEVVALRERVKAVYVNGKEG